MQVRPQADRGFRHEQPGVRRAQLNWRVGGSPGEFPGLLEFQRVHLRVRVRSVDGVPRDSGRLCQRDRQAAALLRVQWSYLREGGWRHSFLELPRDEGPLRAGASPIHTLEASGNYTRHMQSRPPLQLEGGPVPLLLQRWVRL